MPNDLVLPEEARFVSRGVGDMSYRFERIPEPTIAMYVKPLEPRTTLCTQRAAPR